VSSDVKLLRHYLLSVSARDGPIRIISNHIARKPLQSDNTTTIYVVHPFSAFFPGQPG